MLEVNIDKKFIYQPELLYEHTKTVWNQLFTGETARLLIDDGNQCALEVF